MKKFVAMIFLITLISLSAALPNALNNQVGQVGFNSGAAILNPIIDSSSPANTVNIKSFSFQPATLNVPAGTTVTWHNQDNVQHTVTSDVQDLFDSGTIATGKKFTYTFQAPGRYSYHCSIHPGMKGTIIVAGTGQQATQSILPGKLLSSSGIQGINPGSVQENSGNGGSPSWSEKPLSGQTTPVNAGTEGALQSKSQALTLDTLDMPLGQSRGQSSMQSKAVASTLPSKQKEIQQFSQYYRSTSGVPADQLTAPTKIDLQGMEPAMIYFGSSQKAVPYTQYQTYALTTGANSLWIQGASSWTQYAMVPQGSMLNMITMSPTGGSGYLYEVYPDGTLDKNGYYFYPYNQIGFYADQVGEHQLFFNIDGQPSNVIVIDVIAYQPPAPPVYSFASVTISSSWLRGYNVYVDGSLQATEGITGEPDGTVTLNVLGDQYHNIVIDGDMFTFSDYKYFSSGYAYILNV